MVRPLLALAFVLALSPGAIAQTAPLKPPLAGLAFLVGTWNAGTGKVAETGGTSRGSSTIEAAIGGAALLRRDHTELFGLDDKPTGSFDQIMLIYPEGGTLHADYSDGEHVIHYTSAVVTAGKSVTFATIAAPDAPSFRLTYELTSPAILAVRFEMAPPGQTVFRPIATGTLQRGPSDEVEPSAAPPH